MGANTTSPLTVIMTINYWTWEHKEKSIITGPELARTRFFPDAYRHFPLLSFPVPLSPSDHSCSGCWCPDDLGFVITSACGQGFVAQVVLLWRIGDSTRYKVDVL